MCALVSNQWWVPTRKRISGQGLVNIRYWRTTTTRKPRRNHTKDRQIRHRRGWGSTTDFKFRERLSFFTFFIWNEESFQIRLCWKFLSLGSRMNSVVWRMLWSTTTLRGSRWLFTLGCISGGNNHQSGRCFLRGMLTPTSGVIQGSRVSN